jgi:hypothetical protein
VKLYKPNASGTYEGSQNNAIMLADDLIYNAKLAGYQRLNFYYMTKNEPSDKTLSGCFVLYKCQDGKSLGKQLIYTEKAHENWNLAVIDIGDFEKGQSLKFTNYGTTLYLADMYFSGKAYDFEEYTQDLTQEKYSFLWQRNDFGDALLTFGKEVEEKSALSLYKANASGTNVDGPYNALYLNERILYQAKLAGYTKLTFFYKTEIDPKEQATGGCAVIYKYDKGTYANDISSPLYKYDVNAYTGWQFMSIDISEYKDGQYLKFISYGTTLYLSEMRFTGNIQKSDPFADDVFAD